MGGIYGSILKAYCELEAKSGREPASIDLENAGKTVRVSAYFHASGAMDVTVSTTKPDTGGLERAVSKYGGKSVHYGANHETFPGEDIFKIRVKHGTIFDTIEAELPERMNKGNADALKETLDLLKIPYSSGDDGNGGSLSVGTWRLHRRITPEASGKAFRAISDSGAKYPYLFEKGKSSHVYASRKGVFVTLELGSKESEAKRVKRVDELESFLVGCEPSDSYGVKFYGFHNNDPASLGRKKGNSTVIE